MPLCLVSAWSSSSWFIQPLLIRISPNFSPVIRCSSRDSLSWLGVIMFSPRSISPNFLIRSGIFLFFWRKSLLGGELFFAERVVGAFNPLFLQALFFLKNSGFHLFSFFCRRFLFFGEQAYLFVRRFGLGFLFFFPGY